jgi:hypothetical protein
MSGGLCGGGLVDITPRALVVVSPGLEGYRPPCGSGRWRWVAYFGLPFPLPVREALVWVTKTPQASFRCELSNDLSSVTFSSQGGLPERLFARKSSPRAELEKQVSLISHEAHILEVEAPPSSAVIRSVTEYVTASESLKDAEGNFRFCLDSINGVLGTLRTRLPLALAWFVRPLRMIDIAAAYHTAEHLCPSAGEGRWRCVGYYPIMSIPASLAAPLLPLSMKDLGSDMLAQSPPQQPLDEQLLEESFESFFDGRNRLAVISAVTAVELMANEYFATVAAQAKLRQGRSQRQAAEEAEVERKNHRTEFRYLLHRGPSRYGAKSLHDADHGLYEGLLRDQQARHGVAHRGDSPSYEATEELLSRAYAGVSWIRTQLKLPVRPFSLPLQGFAVEARG